MRASAFVVLLSVLVPAACMAPLDTRAPDAAPSETDGEANVAQAQSASQLSATEDGEDCDVLQRGDGPGALESAVYLVWGWHDAPPVVREKPAPTQDGGDVEEAEAEAIPSIERDSGESLDLGVDGESRGETYALDASGDVVAQASGVLLRVDGRFYAYDARKVSVRRTGCEPMPTADLAPEIAQGMQERHDAERDELAAAPNRLVDDASFVDLRTGKRTAAGAGRWSNGAGPADFSFRTALVATIGRNAFVRTWDWGYGCGVHGSSVSSAYVMDIVTGAKVDVTVGAGALELARAQAARRITDGPRDASDMEAVQLLPHRDRSATLAFDMRFSTDACYACSSGDWASYKAATVVPIAEAPERYTGDVLAPEAVQRFARAHTTFHVGGY